MNIPQLTPEELKTLQLFAYYCRSYGADSVYRTYYLSACSKDWEDDRWYSRDVSGGIDGYDRIDELIDKLVDDESITDEFTECDGSQRIEVEIDCKERMLIINAYQTVYGSEPRGLDYDLENIKEEYGENAANAVEELFTYLNGRDAKVNFSGGGDDGYIEDDMIVDGEQEDMPAAIEDLLYSMLNGNFAGWENNEGAQGSWEFNSGDKTILFDFNYNTEEEESVDLDDYEIKF
jgi:hypothetical protein